MTPDQSLLTVDEVATILRVDPETVRRYLREKRLKGTRMRAGWRVRPMAIDAFLAADQRDEQAEVAS